MSAIESYRVQFFYDGDNSRLMAITHDYTAGFTVVNIPTKHYYIVVTLLADGTKTLSTSSRVPATGTLTVGPPSTTTIDWDDDVYHL